MRNVGRAALTIGAIALITGCGGSQLAISAANAMPQGFAIAHAASSGFRVLHRFEHIPRGKYPEGPLVDVHGTLYGTTFGGGLYGYGTVYSIGANGVEKTMYDFHGGTGDGAGPIGGLVYVKGMLYGTTLNGGKTASGRHSCWYEGKWEFDGCGTVFAITPSGHEKVIYDFSRSGADPRDPSSGLIEINGLLYGTTLGGGAGSGRCYTTAGCGTVYSLTTSGKETTLHKFGGNSDGAYPGRGNLLNVNGTLYGTTANGGGTSGYGIVYSVTTKGVEKVVYAFQGGSDGAGPATGLIDVNGTLYGTTAKGGSAGYGTVYGIALQGKEQVVYSFPGGAGGADPFGGLTEISGTLYGTTSAGGTKCEKTGGCGIVFSVTTSGTEQTLHDFEGKGADGAHPEVSLVDVNGTLYGATLNRPGAVFALKP